MTAYTVLTLEVPTRDGAVKGFTARKHSDGRVMPPKGTEVRSSDYVFAVERVEWDVLQDVVHVWLNPNSIAPEECGEIKRRLAADGWDVAEHAA